MTILLLTICLSSAPEKCKEWHYPLPGVPYLQCVYGYSQAIPELSKAIPNGYYIQKGRCTHEPA